MDLLNLPLIEVYQDGNKWKWKILHPFAKGVIGASVNNFSSRADCLADLKNTARLVAAWASAAEAFNNYSPGRKRKLKRERSL